MKKIYTLLMTLVVWVSLVSVAFAADKDGGLIPTNRSEAISYNMARARTVSGYLYSPSMLYKANTETSFWFELSNQGVKNTFKSVAEAIDEKVFLFETFRPEDLCQKYWWIYDEDGYAVFAAYNNFYLKKDGSKWVVPEVAKKNVFICSEVRVLNNVEYADIIRYDEYGNPYYFYPSIQNGKVVIPIGLLGQGYLRVWAQVIPGQYDQVAYDLSTGKQAKTESFILGNQTSFEGVQVIEDTGEVIDVLVESKDGYGISPVVEFTAERTGSYTLLVATTEKEAPTGVTVRSLTLGEIMESPGGSRFQFDLFEGETIHVTFEWAHLMPPLIPPSKG